MEEKLTERLSALEQRLAQLEDRAEIENLMSRHNFLFSAGQGQRIIEELWTRDEHASIEYGASGVYGALWKVRSFYVSEAHPGCFSTVMAANRHLNLDPDGLHARGVYMVIGTETDAGDLGAHRPGHEDQRRVLFTSKTERGEGYRAEILLQQHDVSFVKEDGVWKIHDLRVRELFRCPAGRDWVTFAKERQVTDGMWLEAKFETPEPLPFFENLPSGETTRHWQYDTDALPELQAELEKTR